MERCSQIQCNTNPVLDDLLMIGLDGNLAIRLLSIIARNLLNGSRYEAGQAHGDFAANGLPLFFAPVGAKHYDDYLGWAINYYARQPFPVAQVVLPDTAGRFPWHSGFEERFRAQQPLLHDWAQYTGRPSAEGVEGDA